jgi:membrane protein DedA with SNARE-associated domain
LQILVQHYGLLSVFLLMIIESACIPIPSEAVLPYAGYLSYHGTLSFWSVVIASTIANLIGSLIAYAVGYYGGRPFVERYGRYVFLNMKHLRRAEEWFQKRGEITVFVCRLLPALRAFNSLPAGVGRMSHIRFVVYTTLGSLPWNFALTFAGFKMGQHWTLISQYIKPLTYLGALLLLAAVLWFWFGRKNKISSSVQS